jgi:hypothetical protein
MYPTLVAVLVNSNRTFDQMYFIDPSLPTISPNTSNNHENITGPIQFVVPTNASSMGTFLEQVETKGGLQQA